MKIIVREMWKDASIWKIEFETEYNVETVPEGWLISSGFKKLDDGSWWKRDSWNTGRKIIIK